MRQSTLAPGIVFHPIEPESSRMNMMLGGTCEPVTKGVSGMSRAAGAGALIIIAMANASGRAIRRAS